MIFKKRHGKHNREKLTHRVSSANREDMDTPDRENHLSKGAIAPQSVPKMRYKLGVEGDTAGKFNRTK